MTPLDYTCKVSSSILEEFEVDEVTILGSKLIHGDPRQQNVQSHKVSIRLKTSNECHVMYFDN